MGQKLDMGKLFLGFDGKKQILNQPFDIVIHLFGFQFRKVHQRVGESFHGNDTVQDGFGALLALAISPFFKFKGRSSALLEIMVK